MFRALVRLLIPIVTPAAVGSLAGVSKQYITIIVQKCGRP